MGRHSGLFSPNAAELVNKNIVRDGTSTLDELRSLEIEILPQPDDTTCGPTCLHAVYRYFGDQISLDSVIADCPRLEHGGTLSVLLGCHALRSGYRATIYTFNLTVFDPTWFPSAAEGKPTTPAAEQNERLIHRLRAQMAAKESTRLHRVSNAFCDFLALGGRVRMQDLTGALIRRYLNRGIPLLTGLSSTYLYHVPREMGSDCQSDDVRGYPTGHFVVLCGYDKSEHMVRVADPYLKHPFGENHYYKVAMERLVCAILLGVLTHDAELLIVEPKSS